MCSVGCFPLIEKGTKLLKSRHSVKSHPDVNFTVVINPGNGPGPNPLPDANYTREIPNLASYDNVRLLGYVATTYATRNISLVRKDIETYAAWPTQSANRSLAVNGIFFDETPQQFDANALAYFQELTALVKQSKGLGPENFVSRFPAVIYVTVFYGGHSTLKC